MRSPFNPLDHPVMFSLPRRVTPFSAWIEHIPFAMYLVDLLKPRVIVELGTQYGDSYCALCQAVHELGLDTRCYAVDMWSGDPHSGSYGPEVLADLCAHHDPLYGGISRLIQSTFDEALSGFDDGSIDVLHIDGYHEHESVKHDFEAWLPKLSAAGVVLLHDTNVREGGFGVWRLWNEISSRYPSLEFVHGHGLGVLGVGTMLPGAFQDLIEACADERYLLTVRRLFFELGQTVRKGLNAGPRGVESQATTKEAALASERAGQREAQFAEDLVPQASAATHPNEQVSSAALRDRRVDERAHRLRRLARQVDKRDQTIADLQGRLSAEQERSVQLLTELNRALEWRMSSEDHGRKSRVLLTELEAEQQKRLDFTETVRSIEARLTEMSTRWELSISNLEARLAAIGECQLVETRQIADATALIERLQGQLTSLAETPSAIDAQPARADQPRPDNTEPNHRSLLATRSGPTPRDSSSGAAPIPPNGEKTGDLAVCTIVSKNYLAHARVLMRSFLEHHPGTPAFVLLVDQNDGYFDPDREPFTVISLSDVGIPNLRRLSFQYSVIELNTAVKPYLLSFLADQYGFRRLLYFDPDILILRSLSFLIERLDHHPVVLTPHLIAPLDEDGCRPTEIDILQAGTFNLGFLGLAITTQTRQLLDWWEARLRDRCQMAPSAGMHVDQKWADLFPSFVDDVAILRDPGYNIAYWNLHDRRIQVNDGDVLVNGQPAYFFHFSGFNADQPEKVSGYQSRFTLSRVGDAAVLFARYQGLLAAQGHAVTSRWPYAWGTFDNGVRIPAAGRRLYLRLGDEASRFGDPFKTGSPDSLFAWLNEPAEPNRAAALPAISRLWYEVYGSRPDVKATLPNIFDEDRFAFLEWAKNCGLREHDVDDAFIAPRELATATVSPTPGPRPIPVSSTTDAGLMPKQVAPGIGDTASWGFGVNLAGYFNSEKGVGEAGRSALRALEAAGVDFVLNNFVDPGSFNLERPRHAFSRDNPFPINLVHVNADATAQFAAASTARYFQDRYNIGCWNWELSDFPAEWSDRFDYFHEVWVPSNFCLDAVSRVAPIPVVRIPLCLPETLPTKPLGRTYFGLPLDAFIFLFVFDMHSYVERKNPFALIETFRQAFRSDDRVMLVLKCSHTNRADLAALRKAAEGVNVRIVTRVLTREEINTLMSLCDCYVSLHRSEGFGFTLAETMSLGKPVIATAYSGNMDFMNVGNSLLVEYTLTEIDRDHGVYKKGSVWADPDVSHASHLMRHVFDDPDASRELGLRAQKEIRTMLSPRSIGGLTRNRLSKIGATDGGRTLTAAARRNRDDAGSLENDYPALVGRIREVVSAVLPAGKKVAVISKGDPELLKLDGAQAWHFPQGDDGRYSGHYPADSDEVVRRLEAMRRRGIEYLLVPKTSSWWLEHYQGMSDFLKRRARTVIDQVDACTLFELRAETAQTREKEGPVQTIEVSHDRSAEGDARKVSIVIPVHNKASLTAQCLNAVFATVPPTLSCEVIVVDDASTDETTQMLSEFSDTVRVVRHDSNEGFARSCNDGASIARGDYIVFLNNDTVAQDGWLEALTGYADSHGECGIVGSKLLFPNKTIQHAGVVICQDRLPRHIYVAFPAEHPAVNQSRRFRAVTGACMLVRRDLFTKLNGFDTAFSNSFEDIDLCLRAADVGQQVHYCHTSVLYHLESVTRDGRSQDEARSRAIFNERWRSRLEPDDLRYFVEDGMLSVSYVSTYPLPFRVSPLLGVVETDDHASAVNRLLAARSRQSHELLKENIRLLVRLQESTRQAGHRAPASWSRKDDTLQDGLFEGQEQLLRQDEELLSVLARLRLPADGDEGHDSALKHVKYRSMTARIRLIVSTTLPADATVLVVSKGDEDQLRHESRRAWHFPRADNGVYAGYYPESSDAAIAHCEALRAKGADYLIFPATALWWLEHYSGFRTHLNSCYRRIVDVPDTCVIYALRSEAAVAPLPKDAFRAKLSVVSAPERLYQGDSTTLWVRVENMGTVPWPASGDENGRYRVALGSRWLDVNGIPGGAGEARVPLPHDLVVGAVVDLEITVTAPTRPAAYALEIDMVQEQVAWFRERGSATVTVPIRVTAPHELAPPAPVSSVLLYDRPKPVTLVSERSNASTRSRPRAIPKANGRATRANGQAKRGKRA